MQFSKHTFVYLLLHIVTHIFYQVYFEELNAYIKFEGLNAPLFYSCGAFNFTNGTNCLTQASKAIFCADSLPYLTYNSVQIANICYLAFRHGASDNRTINNEIPVASGKTNVLYMDGHSVAASCFELGRKADGTASNSAAMSSSNSIDCGYERTKGVILYE